MLAWDERRQPEAQWDTGDWLIVIFAWLVRIVALPIVVIALLWIAITAGRTDDGR